MPTITTDRALDVALAAYNKGQEVAALSEREETEARERAVAALLTRQRSRWGQPCLASQRVFDAISEMDQAKGNELTGLIHWGVDSGHPDFAEIGRLVFEHVVGCVGEGVDMDRATADLLEGRE